jgi:hypothetical protein
VGSNAKSTSGNVQNLVFQRFCSESTDNAETWTDTQVNLSIRLVHP